MGNQVDKDASLFEESIEDLKPKIKNLETAYQDLKPLQQQQISVISKNISLVLIENFRSLTLLLTLLNNNEDNFDDESATFQDGNDLQIWLGEMNKRVFLFNRSMKKFRMTVLNVLGFSDAKNPLKMNFKEKNENRNNEKLDTEATELEKDEFCRLLYLLSEGSYTSVFSYLKEMEEIRCEEIGEAACNLGKNLEDIVKILKLEKVDERFSKKKAEKIRLSSYRSSSYYEKQGSSSARSENFKSQLRSQRRSSDIMSNLSGIKHKRARSSLSKIKDIGSAPAKQMHFNFNVSLPSESNESSNKTVKKLISPRRTKRGDLFKKKKRKKQIKLKMPIKESGSRGSRDLKVEEINLPPRARRSPVKVQPGFLRQTSILQRNNKPALLEKREDYRKPRVGVVGQGRSRRSAKRFTTANVIFFLLKIL